MGRKMNSTGRSRSGRPATYFHGGAPGLKQGDKILPPAVTGVVTRAENVQTLGEVPDWMWDPAATGDRDVVYLCQSADHAAGFASITPHGDIYRVTPLGPVEPDPDHPVAWVTCRAARVDRVIARGVDLSGMHCNALLSDVTTWADGSPVYCDCGLFTAPPGEDPVNVAEANDDQMRAAWEWLDAHGFGADGNSAARTTRELLRRALEHGHPGVENVPAPFAEWLLAPLDDKEETHQPRQ